MKIREFREGDFQELNELAKRNGLELPPDGKLILAEDELGKIVAFCVVRPVLVIEPFCAENSLSGKKLWDQLEWAMNTSDIKTVRANLIDEKNIELLEKLGFERVLEGQIQMQKLY